MDRIALLNMIARRQSTVQYAEKSVHFLDAYNSATSGRYGVPVDGDAIALLRKAVSA